MRQGLRGGGDNNKKKRDTINSIREDRNSHKKKMRRREMGRFQMKTIGQTVALESETTKMAMRNSVPGKKMTRR